MILCLHETGPEITFILEFSHLLKDQCIIIPIFNHESILFSLQFLKLSLLLNYERSSEINRKIFCVYTHPTPNSSRPADSGFDLNIGMA
jgi:hypothetical protein